MALSKIELVLHIEQGASINSIAKHFKCSAGTVRHWLNKYELKTHNKCRKFGKNHLLNCECGEKNPKNFYRKRQYQCKKCVIKYRVNYDRKRKQKLLEIKGNKCEKCGYNKCPGALVFHHKNPSLKDPDWVNFRKYDINKTLRELDKCQLLCANCHAETHWGNK